MSTLSADIVRANSQPQELDDLFRRHYRLIFRTAYAIVGSAVDAEDVVQTIFLRLIRGEPPADLQKNPGGYLYRAAVNESLSVIRNRQRRIRREDTVQFTNAQLPSASTDHDEEMYRRLYAAIAELNPQAAHILVLRYIHDYSDAEIARLLGRSRTSIAVTLFRSRSRLKKLLRRLERE